MDGLTDPEILRKCRTPSPLCGAGLLVAGALLVGLALAGGRPVSREGYARIGKGMRKEEVVQILGPCTNSGIGRWPPGPNWIETAVWEGGSYVVEVEFSFDIAPCRDRGAVRKALFEKESVPDRLRRWLNLPPTGNRIFEIEKFK